MTIPLILEIDGTRARIGANVARDALKDVKKEGKETVTVIDSVRGSFDRMVTAARYLGGALAVRQIIAYSDAWKQLQGRLSLVTDGTEDFAQKQRALFDIAQRNRQSLEGVYQLYTRLGQAIGKNTELQAQALGVTEAFAKGLAITGESAAAAQGVIVQFTQGLATGFRAGGQELNSLLEQAPRVAKALAAGLNEIGVTSQATAGSLKQLAQDGVLNASNVFAALQSQLPKLTEEFEKIPRTVGQAFTQLDNAFLRFIGSNEAVLTGTSSLAIAVGKLAENFETLAQGVIALTTAYAISLVPAIYTAIAAFTAEVYTMTLGARTAALKSAAMLGLAAAETEATAASVALTTAMNLIPFVAIGTGIFLTIKYFDELHATMTLLTGGVLKFANTAYAGVVGTFRGIVEAVKNTGKVLDAFVTDLAEFVADPFHAQGFDNFKRALSQGYGEAFHGAFDSALKEAQDFNNALDGAVDDKIEEIAAKSKKEASNIAKPYTTAAAAAHDMAKGIDESTEKTKKLKEQADPVAKIFKETANEIRQSFASAFEKLFGGELNSFKDFVGSIKSIFIKMLSELATLAIAKPVIIPVVAALGGALGLSGDAISSVTGSLGGGTDLLSGGSSLLSGIINGFNAPLEILQKGAVSISNVLGLAFDTKLALFDIASKFTPAAGLAGFGGNAIANLIFGNRGIGATIGGTAGGVIGTAVGGPIGAAIGSFLGNAIGGLFGNKKPSDKTQTGRVNLDTGEIYGRTGLGGVDPNNPGKKFDINNYNAVTSFSQFAKQIADSLGGVAGSLELIVGNRDGLRLSYNGGAQVNYGSDPGAFVKGIIETLNNAAPEINKNLKTALENIDFSNVKDNLQQIISDVNFAASFDKLGESFEKLSFTQKELDFTNLNAQLEEMRKTTERLGLSVEAFDGKAKRIVENFVNEYNTSLANSLIKSTSPLTAALTDEAARFKAELKEAQTIGGDLSLVYQIHAQQVTNIEQQYSGVTQELQAQANAAQQLADNYGDVAKTLDQALFNLRVGNLTTLNPAQQLAEARARFLDTARAARGGDIESAQQLPALANTFLQISKSFFGSTTGFANDFDLVQSEITASRDVAMQQADYQAQIVRNTSAQITATQQGFARVESIMKMTAFATANNATDFTGGTFNTNNPNEVVVRNIDAIKSRGLFPLVDQLLYTYTAGITPGNKRRSQFFELYPDQAALFRAEAHKFGIPGFARGGTTPMNSPFQVGENGAEIMTSRNPAMVIPIQNNAAILLEIQQSNRHLGAAVRVLSSGMTKLSEQGEKNSAAIRRLADAQRNRNTMKAS